MVKIAKYMGFCMYRMSYLILLVPRNSTMMRGYGRGMCSAFSAKAILAETGTPETITLSQER